jgi:hypothetical protein
MGSVKATVVKHEKMGDVMCARLETNTGGQTIAEHVAAGDDGIYRYSMAGNKADPPVRFLKLPFTKGDTWTVHSRVGNENLSVTYVIDEEEIVVPAGKFQTVVTRTTNFEANGQKLAATVWYAKGVGMVKTHMSIAGRDIVMELQKFEPAK